jgi:hypothetical protein
MSTAIDEIDIMSRETSMPVGEAAREIRQNMGAIRVAFRWFGTRRSLSDAQTRQAANQFDADAEQVSAYKKLVDTKHPAWKALTAIKGEVISYWRGITLPYPLDGIRLIRRDDIAGFEEKMQGFRDRLAEAVTNLQAEFENIKARAREHLGSLYDPSDYPTSLEGMFQINWEYPSVEPPRYLMQFNPELYEQEQRRIQQRFEQSITMAEDAFAEKLQELVEHLVERLSDNSDGKPKVFQKSTVENFRAFYEEFKNLNVRGNTELDSLVSRANDLVSGVDAQDLRNSARLRASLSEQMGEVRSALDTLIANQPRRRIMRLD